MKKEPSKFELEAKEFAEKGKKKTKGLLTEFRTFITKGSVLDLATGVIVANAFTKIVNSFSSAIIMPIINALLSLGTDQPELITILNKEPRYITIDGVNQVNPDCIYINWSQFIQAVIDFFFIALIIFIFIKIIRHIENKVEFINSKIHEKELKELKEKEDKERFEQERLAKELAEQKAIEDKNKAENTSTNELLVEVINLLKEGK